MQAFKAEGISISIRSIQRHLKTLIEAGHVQSHTQGKYRVYQLNFSEMTADIPLSIPSYGVLHQIRQPLAKRPVVGYERSLLDEYIPNQTQYLGGSTCRHLEQMGRLDTDMLPAGTYAQDLLNRFLIDLSWASSHLEGNTYTYLETKELIEFGKSALDRDLQETQMILNHKAAISFLIAEKIASTMIPFSNQIILNLHGLLSENLLSDPDSSGRLRTRPVEIGKSTYRPLGIPLLIQELFEIILKKTKQIKNPFEQAFFFMVHLPYLQPFEDVNKRVSRLGANISLLNHGLCPLTFLSIPEKLYIDSILAIYELNRIELFRDFFVYAYERSTREYLAIHKSLIQPDPIKLKYRTIIHSLIKQIVTENLKKPIGFIQKNLNSNTHIPESDRNLIFENILDDLKRLHPGVLARYQISMQEYLAWKKNF